MTNLVERFKQWLGIESPSRAWISLRDDERLRDAFIEGALAPHDKPLPWYAARTNRDAYEYPELRRTARFVRRLIRRHWYELMFESDGPMAASVRAVMAHPPERPEPERVNNIYQQMRDLIDAGNITIDPDAVREFAEQCGVRLKGEP